MDLKTFRRTILSYSMKALIYPPIEKYKLKGYEKVDFYIVNSKFEKLFEKHNVDINEWKDVYKELYDKYKEKSDNFSRYIIMSDEDNNVLYCTKLK